MPALYEIRFEPSGQVARYCGSRGNYYELADGSTLDLHSELVWCRQCQKWTNGEQIDSLGEIERQIADCADPRSMTYQMAMTGPLHELTGNGPEFLREQAEKLRKRRTWRQARRSPPKCITCGSADIVSPGIDTPVPHPAGSGTVTISIVGLCSTNFNEWFFTPEGDRIPRDTKPTYWHHPELDNSPEALREFLRQIDVDEDECANE